MRRLLLLIIPIIILLSGCISEFDIISTQHHPNDELYLDFQLPASVDTRQGFKISYSVSASNGTQWGVYTVRNNLSAHNPNIVFDRSGIWQVNYEIFEGETKKVEGTQTFFITDGQTHRYEFTLTECEVVNHRLTATIENTGRDAGWLHVALYDDEPYIQDGIEYYGHVYFKDSEYLRIGHEYEISENLIPGANPVLIINEVEKWVK